MGISGIGDYFTNMFGGKKLEQTDWTSYTLANGTPGQIATAMTTNVTTTNSTITPIAGTITSVYGGQYTVHTSGAGISYLTVPHVPEAEPEDPDPVRRAINNAIRDLSR